MHHKSATNGISRRPAQLEAIRMRRFQDAAKLIGEFAIVMIAYAIVSRILVEFSPYIAK